MPISKPYSKSIYFFQPIFTEVFLRINSAGVSQIILPQWFDTFDFAQRVEYLGVGIYGSRSTVPKITSDELGQALITITDEKDERGREIARKAEELGKQIRRCYRGREAAADKIIELAEYSEFCNYWDVL